MHDYETMFNLIQNSTYIENVNKGVAPQTDYFGARDVQGMAYSKNSMYNNENTMCADMTKPQSHYMNPKQGMK